jgi:hypothetical protein
MRFQRPASFVEILFVAVIASQMEQSRGMVLGGLGVTLVDLEAGPVLLLVADAGMPADGPSRNDLSRADRDPESEASNRRRRISTSRTC